MRVSLTLMYLLLIGAVPAGAVGKVELQVGAQQAYVNEAFQIALVIEDFQQCEPPEPPSIPDCTVRNLGTPSDMSQISIINGRRTESHSRVYKYELTPRASGELVIPSFSVRVDGRSVPTREVRLPVGPSNVDELFSIDVTTGRTRVYVGQRIRATLTIWVRPPVYGGQALGAEDTYRLLNPIEFGPFSFRDVSSYGERKRTVAGREQPFFAFEFVSEFVPERPGPLTFDNIEVGLVYPTRGGQRNLRQHPTVQPCEVVPIPSEGRPANFTGAVGLFDLQATARPDRVRVGDPIELTLEVFGDGPIDRLPPPNLAAQTPLTDDFRVPDEPLAGEVLKNRHKRFVVTLRAKRADVKAIPAIEYPYFDPDAERFVVARSKPLPLTVDPAAEVEAPDVAGQAGPAPRTSADLQALDGLHDVQTSETRLLAGARPITFTIVALTMLAPPMVFLAAWAGVAVVQRRAADPARRRREQAARTARRRILSTISGAPASGGAATTAPPASEVMTALTAYLADRLNEPPARFTGRSALEFLRQRGTCTGLVDQWAGILTRCEEASFAGGAAADGNALAQQALACLTALEREKL